jgi:hypothetical protein
MKKKEKEAIFEKLCAVGEIKYNHHIDKEILGDLFGTHDYDSLAYRSAIMQLMAFIDQDKGMPCQTYHLNLYIKPLKDAPQALERRIKRGNKQHARGRKQAENMPMHKFDNDTKSEVVHMQSWLNRLGRSSRLIRKEIEYYAI